jgi:hypothetical protein
MNFNKDHLKYRNKILITMKNNRNNMKSNKFTNNNNKINYNNNVRNLQVLNNLIRLQK